MIYCAIINTHDNRLSPQPVKWKIVSHSVTRYEFLSDTDILECLFTYAQSKNNGSVSIEAHYGLDSPGIESRWGRDFSASIQTSPGAHPASYKMGTGSFQQGKVAGAWR